MNALYAAEKAETIAAIESLLAQADRDGWSEAVQQEAVRLAHSLKGAAAAMGDEALSRLARILEERLAKWPGKEALLDTNAPRELHSDHRPSEWRVTLTPAPHVRASRAMQEALVAALTAFGTVRADPDPIAEDATTWSWIVSSAAADKRALRDAVELFAVPGSVAVESLAQEPAQLAPQLDAQSVLEAPSVPTEPVTGGRHFSTASLTSVAGEPVCEPAADGPSWRLWWRALVSAQPNAPFFPETGHDDDDARRTTHLPLSLWAQTWQGVWQEALPGWSVTVTADPVPITPAFAERLDRWQAVALEAAKARAASTPLGMTMRCYRMGATLRLVLSGDPDAIATVKAAWLSQATAQAAWGVRETRDGWEVAIPFAPAILWAFWLTVAEQAVAVPAESVAAFFPQVSKQGCRFVNGVWYLSVADTPYPWRPLLPEAQRPPFTYSLVVALSCGKQTVLTGVDDAERAGGIATQPLPDGAAPPAGCVALATRGQALATVLDPQWWWAASSPR
nr:Hpt domain-containing protein [Hydrogenophilus thiooxidans]